MIIYIPLFLSIVTRNNTIHVITINFVSVFLYIIISETKITDNVTDAENKVSLITDVKKPGKIGEKPIQKVNINKISFGAFLFFKKEKEYANIAIHIMA